MTDDVALDPQRAWLRKQTHYAEHYLESHGNVDGWLEDLTAHATGYLLQEQHRHGIRGSVLEIGVHHGRYFLVLATSLGIDECGIAVDLFDDQHLNSSQSGKGNWTEFVWNVAEFAPLSRVVIIKSDSRELGEEFVSRYRGLRFVSVDGGHDRATACADLLLAEKLLRQGGVVALDDIYRPDWSGVTAALHRYLQQGGQLIPFALIPNKLLLTTDVEWCRTYSESLHDRFRSYCLPNRTRVEFFDFDDVLLLHDGSA